jgi:HNH endonuclease
MALTPEQEAYVRRMYVPGVFGGPQVAKELGISQRQVYNIVSPGYEVRSRASASAWKKRQRGKCEICGAKTSYSGRDGHRTSRWCRDCAAEQNRKWTRGQIVEAIQEWAKRRGKPPVATEWRRTIVDPDGYVFPTSSMLYQSRLEPLFPSWAAAIEAAGFPRPPVGRYVRTEETLRRISESRTVWTRERIIEAIRLYARSHGQPPTSAQWGKGKPGHNPCYGTVLRRFDSWGEAIEAAGFSSKGRQDTGRA